MTDKELGQTKTVKMRIDKRKLVEEAVNEMMDSGIIEIQISLELPDSDS